MRGTGTGVRAPHGPGGVETGAGTSAVTRGTTASPMEEAKTDVVPCVGVSGSDEAQQRSASACVIDRVEPWRDSDPCMAQVPCSTQQAMRASRVGSQPAHTIPWPTASTTARVSAARRLTGVSTPVECANAASVSNILAAAILSTTSAHQPERGDLDVENVTSRGIQLNGWPSAAIGAPPRDTPPSPTTPPATAAR